VPSIAQIGSLAMEKICFNTTPADTVEAVQRWIKP
jgi:hypothetical protein